MTEESKLTRLAPNKKIAQSQMMTRFEKSAVHPATPNIPQRCKFTLKNSISSKTLEANQELHVMMTKHE
jgi:hypothetical protein